jgi:hypothetical protein
LDPPSSLAIESRNVFRELRIWRPQGP